MRDALHEAFEADPNLLGRSFSLEPEPNG